jgi:hypothetical protein
MDNYLEHLYGIMHARTQAHTHTHTQDYLSVYYFKFVLYLLDKLKTDPKQYFSNVVSHQVGV